MGLGKSAAALAVVLAAMLVPMAAGDREEGRSNPSPGFWTQWDPFITLANPLSGGGDDEDDGGDDGDDDDDWDDDSEERDRRLGRSRNWVRALITSGDTLPDGFTFGNIPDGIGAVTLRDGTVDVFVSHETNNGPNHGGWAKVSRFLYREGTGTLLRAEMAIDGSQEYERFCSSSAVQGYGFRNPIYFANEEVEDGIVVAVDARTKAIIEMPWLGMLSHENTVHVPWFFTTARKTVVLTFEDGEATESEVYMYVANSPRDLLEGGGQLYVFASADSRNSWDGIYYETGDIRGRFVPLNWDYRTQDEVDLHDEAIAEGAFQFIRPEDGAMDKRPGRRNVLYVADTGSDRDEAGVLIPPGKNGQTWERGRIYRFGFTNPRDPTQATIRVMLDGNDPRAPGFGVMSNPDNVDTSRRSLMIQEDRIAVTQYAVTNPYDLTKNAKIIHLNLRTGELTVVAYVNQYADLQARHGNWESSGILDVSPYFGRGTWLATVQAHSLWEGGQLLLLRLGGT